MVNIHHRGGVASGQRTKDYLEAAWGLPSPEFREGGVNEPDFDGLSEQTVLGNSPVLGLTPAISSNED